MAELHIIGQLVGGHGFPSANLFCKWGTAFGTAWKVLEGKQDGQTQVDHPKVRDFLSLMMDSNITLQDGSFAKWSHPIGTGDLVAGEMYG